MSKKNDDIDNNKSGYTQHEFNSHSTSNSLKIKKKLDKPCRNMVKYRLCRNRIFYFRIAIPSSLRSRFGRNEFIYSLRTSDSIRANQRCWAMLDIALMLFRVAEVHNYTNPDELNERTKHHFKKCMDRFTQNHHRTNQSVRGEPMTQTQMTIENNIPTKTQIKEIVKEVYDRWVVGLEEDMLTDVGFDHLDVAKRADGSMNCEQFFSDCLQDRTYDVGMLPKDIGSVIKEYNLDIEGGSLLYNFLCREYCKAGIEFCQLEYKRLQGD